MRYIPIPRPAGLQRGRLDIFVVILAKVALRSKTLASPIRLSHRSIADWRRIY